MKATKWLNIRNSRISIWKSKRSSESGKPVLSFFGLFLDLRSPPGIVIRNVIYDFDGSHTPVSELEMGLGIVAGGEVDLGGAFMVEGLFGGVVVKAPVGQRCRDDDRLVEEAAAEAIFCTAVEDTLA